MKNINYKKYYFIIPYMSKYIDRLNISDTFSKNFYFLLNVPTFILNICLNISDFVEKKFSTP